jgi:hypothetical protein
MGRKVKADGEKKVGQDMQTNCVTDVWRYPEATNWFNQESDSFAF